MKSILRALAVILLLGGTIFFFQGLNVIKGSFMTGQAFWAWVGLLMDVVGVALLGFTFVRRG